MTLGVAKFQVDDKEGGRQEGGSDLNVQWTLTGTSEYVSDPLCAAN